MTNADIQWVMEWSNARLTEEEAISNIIAYWKFRKEHGREPQGIFAEAYGRYLREEG